MIQKQVKMILSRRSNIVIFPILLFCSCSKTQYPIIGEEWVLHKDIKAEHVDAYFAEVTDSSFFQAIDSLIKLHPDYRDQYTKYVQLRVYPEDESDYRYGVFNGGDS